MVAASSRWRDNKTETCSRYVKDSMHIMQNCAFWCYKSLSLRHNVRNKHCINRICSTNWKDQKLVCYNPDRRPPLGRPGHGKKDNTNINFIDIPLNLQRSGCVWILTFNNWCLWEVYKNSG